jgi:MraZ protein
LFIGRHPITVDNENRVTVPPRFSERLSGGGIITQGFDRNLWVLPAETFQLLCQRISAMNLTDPIARLLLRMIFGRAFELEVDQSGIMYIPQSLREYAELQDDIVLVGQGDYFEIWDSALWVEQESKLGDANTNTERFAKFVIALSAS